MAMLWLMEQVHQMLMSLPKKRKHSLNSSDPSYSESGKFTENMEHLADSISGLVSVAQQSHQTQQINIMHRHRKELEDSIEKIEGSCIELELRLLGSTGTRKQVFKRALRKNHDLMEHKRKELEETIIMIHNQSTLTTSTPPTMPSFVNADGSRTVESNNKMTND